VTLRAVSTARQIVIDGPVNVTLSVEPGATITTTAARLAGLYTVSGAASPMNRLAVGVLSDVESDIRPRENVTVNSESTTVRRASATVPRPLWPWLVAAAFALMVLEWLVYCHRVRGRP
jgi:hypothetical protein